MKKKLIVKISEGLGNQLFMYANAYAISKKFNIDFYIDPYSGYYKKNVWNYMLDNFNITSNIAPSNWIFSNNYRNILKKILIKFEYFKSNKSYLFEKKDSNKQTKYSPINLDHTNNEVYIDGNFESEEYFSEYRNQLLNEFSFKEYKTYKENPYLKTINNDNVVSISIRQNRFSERVNNKYEKKSIIKSDIFVKETINYVYKSIEFFKKKINNPKFLIWSNDFKNLDNYFPKDKFTFVENSINKELSDFYLLTQCKNFIVGPSTFSWWGAWLSKNENKICVRPSNINPSNNLDFWPKSWISI